MALKARLAVWGKAAASAYGVVLAIGLPLVAWVIYHTAATYYEPVLGTMLVGIPLHAVVTAPAVTLYILICYRVLRFIPGLITRPFKGSETLGVIVMAAIAALPAVFVALNGERVIASAMAAIILAAFLVVSRILGGEISAGEQAWGKAVLVACGITLAGCLVGSVLYTAQQLDALSDLEPEAWIQRLGVDSAVLGVVAIPYVLAAYAVLNLARRRVLRLAKGQDSEDGVFLIAGVAAAPLIIGLGFASNLPFKGLFMAITGITLMAAFSVIWRMTGKATAPAA